MTRTALAVALSLAFALPATAQNLSLLLPVISFPDPVISVPSTKGCLPDSPVAVCTGQE